MLPQDPPTARRYLLTIWTEREQRAEDAQRYSLEDLSSHKRKGFKSLADLYIFLKGQVERG